MFVKTNQSSSRFTRAGVLVVTTRPHIEAMHPQVLLAQRPSKPVAESVTMREMREMRAMRVHDSLFRGHDVHVTCFYAVPAWLAVCSAGRPKAGWHACAIARASLAFGAFVPAASLE